MKKIMKNFVVMGVTTMMLFSAKPADAAYLVSDVKVQAETMATRVLTESIKTGTINIQGIVGDTYNLLTKEMSPLEKTLTQAAINLAFNKNLNVNNLLKDVVGVIDFGENTKAIQTATKIITNSRTSEDIRKNVTNALADAMTQYMKQKQAIEQKEKVICQQLDEIDAQIKELAKKAGDPQASQKSVEQAEAEITALDSKKKSLHALLDELHLKHKEAEDIYKVNRQEIEDKAEQARSEQTGTEFDNMGNEASRKMNWDGTMRNWRKK